MSLKTEVDTKYLGTALTVEEELVDGDHYTYKARKGEQLYIIRGYEFILEDTKTDDTLPEILPYLSIIHKQYYTSSVLSTISNHFLKPLAIDYKQCKTVISSSLCIEVLFEYGGVVLSKLKKLEMHLTYNLMRQSAAILALLHALGFTNLNVLLSNMAYEESEDILKLIEVENVEESSKGFEEQLPPEALQGRESSGEGTDIYRWAMIFYSLVLAKDSAALRNEVNLYKLDEGSKYERFLEFMKEDVEKVSEKDSRRSVKELIVRLLERCLAFNPKERPGFAEIVKEMREFERAEGMETYYSKIESVQSSKISHLFSLTPAKGGELEQLMREVEAQKKQKEALEKQLAKIKQEHGNAERNNFKEEVKGKSVDTAVVEKAGVTCSVIGEEVKEGEVGSKSRCRNCLNAKKLKAKLKCGHFVCSDCLLVHIMSKFANNKAYNHKIFCSDCTNTGTISTLYLNCGCEWELSPANRLIAASANAPKQLPSFRCRQSHDLTYAESAMIEDYELIAALCEQFQSSMKAAGKEFKATFQHLCDVRAMAIARAVVENESITTLNLSNNKIKSPGAVGMGRMLQENAVLRVLNLSKVGATVGENNIGNSGARAIGNALLKNSALLELNLCDLAVKL